MNRPNRLQGAFLVCLAVSTLEAQDSDTSLTQTPAFTPSPDAKLQPLPPFSAHRLTGKRILSFPFRGLQNYLSILPGVVLQNGNLHFRGGRAGEVGYFVDGFSVTNPFFNSNGVEIIPEAIEELDVVTGAYGPEFGRSNAGLVRTRMKTGSDSLQFFFSGQTDNLVNTGSEFWKTTSFGYRNYVGTIGGPVVPGIKFFVAGEYEYFGNRQQMFLEPFRFEGLVTDGLGSRPAGTPLPGPVEFRRNFLDNNWSSAATLQGNTSIEFGDMSLRVVGSYSAEDWLDGGNWPVALQNIYRQKRNMHNETRSWFGGLTFSHSLSEDLSYEISVSVYDRFSRRYDPDFGDDWQLYSDSLANARKGYTGFYTRYSGPPSYSTIFTFQINDPNMPNNQYRKDRQSSWGLAGKINYRFSDSWLVHGGAEMQSWTMRRFNLSSSSSLMSFLYGPNGLQPRVFNSEYEKRVQAISYGSIDNYGYAYLGDQVEDGYDAPRQPRFRSVYLNNVFRDSGFELSIGGRYEVFDLRIPTPIPLDGRKYDYYVDYSTFYGIVSENKYTEQPSTGIFLPRLSLSYEVSPNLSAFASVGKYAQTTSLNSLLIGNVLLSSRLNPNTRVPYWFGGSLAGFMAKPELSTQYEFGVRHRLSDVLGVSFRAYYKSLSHQLQLGRVYDDNNKPAFVALLNNGEGISSGVEMALSMSSQRLSASLTYSLSDARGKSSTPTWNWFEVTDEQLPPIPQRLFPFEYDQTHRGSLLLDLHFGEDDGDILGGLGITAIASFNNGHRYTRFEELLYFGAASPWNVGVRQILDPRSAIPLETWNASPTPWTFNIDLGVRKQIQLGSINFEISVQALNVSNTKNILNVYPTTGTPTDDGWLGSRFAQNYIPIPLFEEFYRTINLQNRWAYTGATGNDIYGSPRQIRLGITVRM